MKKFLALCYHYIKKPEEKEDPFSRILGNPTREFINHVKNLGSHYKIISPDEARNLYFSKEQCIEKEEAGLLLTFDDGLSDHYQAAKILHGYGIKAWFFIPTCILMDGLPANPIIVHYCLAKYGINLFLNIFQETVNKFGIGIPVLRFNKGDDVWEIIAKIKRTIKYQISAAYSRKILLHIYENTLHRDHPNILEIMHLTEPQIKEMLTMGHSIGSHTHSHFSVASSGLSNLEIEQEIVIPKLFLEQRFGIKVSALSYPFGEPVDCFTTYELISLTRSYDLAFTVEEKLNTLETPPLQLGRYMPTSKDTSADILRKLKQTKEQQCV